MLIKDIKHEKRPLKVAALFSIRLLVLVNFTKSLNVSESSLSVSFAVLI